MEGWLYLPRKAYLCFGRRRLGGHRYQHRRHINPSATSDEVAAAGELHNVALVLLPHTAGKNIAAMLDASGLFGYGNVLFSIDPEGWSSQPRLGEIDVMIKNARRHMYYTWTGIPC